MNPALLLVILIAGAAQKTGLLLLMGWHVFDPESKTTLAMLLMYAPIPITSGLLFLFPLRNPARALIAIFVYMAVIMICGNMLGDASLAMMTSASTLFSVSMASLIATMEKDAGRLRVYFNCVIGASILGEGLGSLIAGYGFTTATGLVIALYIAIVLLPDFEGGVAHKKKETLSFADIKFPLVSTLVMISVFLTCGMADKRLVLLLKELGMKEDVYGTFLVFHSAASLLALLLPRKLSGFYTWAVIWLIAIAGVFMHSFSIFYVSYSLFGAGGTILYREYMVKVMPNSTNKSRDAALIMLIFSAVMAIGVLF